MSVYYGSFGGISTPAPGPPAKAAAPPTNKQLLAQGKGPLKAPAKPSTVRVTNTQTAAKATAPPKNFKQAVALKEQIRARVQAQYPKLPGWAIDQIAAKQMQAGPKGDAGSQLNAAELATAAQVGVRPTEAGAALNTTGDVVNALARGLVHPATDLARGPSSVSGALSDVGNLALNLVTPEKAVGVAGLFGLKGLKDAKVGEDAYTAAKAAKAASPEAKAALQEGLKGAKSRYGVEKAARSVELEKRAADVHKALTTISDPHEAMAAASQAMRGELPKIDFQGLKELNPTTLKQLMVHVNQHETLLPFQKLTLNKALNAAVSDGRVPRPHEMRLIEHVFGKRTAVGIAQQAGQGIGDKVINLLNVPRSLMATGDLSGIGRQSLVAGASHPVMWARNFPTAFKAMGSPQFYERSSQAIKDDEDYHLSLAGGVSYTDLGEESPLISHEEAFSSDYAAKIPVVGRIVKASARAYVGFLNKMRLDLFKNQLRIARAAGRNVQDEKFLKSIGDVVNAATGRGTIHGRAEHLLPALNTVLFSPRLMLSRINYLDPSWYVRLDPQARREALRGLFATAGAVSGILYLASRIPGVTVGSMDPRSADFGKIKVNNTRIDIAGGFQQYVRLAAELATNTSVSSTSGAKTKLGSGFGIPTRLDVLQDFGYNKLAPPLGIGVNLVRGHDAVGNPVTAKSIAENNFTPLLFQDAKDIYNEKHGGVDGITWALGGYGLGAFGVGLQTYAPKAPKTPAVGGSYFSGGSAGGGGSVYYGGGSNTGGGSAYYGSP